MKLFSVLLMLFAATDAFADYSIPNNGGRATLATTYTRHIQIPPLLVGNASTQPTPDGVGSAACLSFPTTGTKYAYFQWEMPIDWTGGNITVEVDWVPFSGSMSGTDTVKWIVAYGTRAEGEAINGSLTSVPSTIDADITQYVTTHTAHTIAYNDATNPLVHEDHVFFRITRDTSVANDFGGDVCVTAFEIIYTSDGFPETN